MLSGHQFFSWEIEPIVGAAKNYAEGRYFQLLDYEGSPELNFWRKAFSALTGLAVEARKRAREDEFSASPAAYRAVSPFWQQVDLALDDVRDVPEVAAMVAQLPVDGRAAQGNINKLGVAVGLLGIGVGLWLWGKGRL